MQKEKILKVLAEESIAVKDMDDLDEIDSMFERLESEGVISFGVYIRSDRNGSDYWLNCEYYSPKLQKTIIMDYDYQSSFSDVEDLLERIEWTETAIRELEESITIKK